MSRVVVTRSAKAFPTVAERRRPTWVMTSRPLDDVEKCAAERMASAAQGARGDLGFAIRTVRHVPGLCGCASQMVPWPSGVTARTALQRSDSAE